MSTLIRARMKAVVILMLIIISTGMAQEVPVGKCIVPLDFGGQKLTIEPSDTSVNDDVIKDMTILIDESTNTSGYVDIVDFPTSYPVSILESGLTAAMKRMCGRVSTEKYDRGFLSSGLFKSGGQKAWGIILPLDQNGDQFNRTVVVLLAFKNETLNEQMVGSLMVEKIKCTE
jgi:hypothetical protein